MIIDTKLGKIEGTTEKGCYVFKGVPYAKAPTGDRRFKKPEAIESFGVEVYQADHYRAKAMQGPKRGGFYDKEFYSNPDFETPQSEDCLYLNIWIPEKEYGEGSKLPVAVYVHGGAFMGGAGSNLPFVCNKLCERGVIVVTINYRLGALGFLCHPLIAAEGENAAGGNLGLWDQLQAFRWVKENIASFGGDPENITAFGQSAGAMSLQSLALTSQMTGLCYRMILQSGGGYQNPLGVLRTREKAYEIAEILFEELDIDTLRCVDDEQYKEDAIRMLIEIPEKELMDKVGITIGRSFQEKKGMPFVPVIDGELLTDDAVKLMDDGHYLKIPYILGCNGDDLTTEGNEVKSPDRNPMHQADVAFAEMADGYVYYFDRKMPGDDAGSFHAAELWYVFGSLEYCWRPLEDKDREISDRMITYWTNFMKTGDPNMPDSDVDKWEKYRENNTFMRFE